MIQDILPHRLYNEFLVKTEPNPEDIIICVKDNALMVGVNPGKMIFPKRQDFCDEIKCRYLFSLDDNCIYLANSYEIETIDGFSYMTLKEVRQNMKKPLPYMYVAYTAWHLAEWYRDNHFCGRCGNETHHSEKERAVICPKCGNIIYPRIVPAVIVGIINGNKILMTKYANRNLPYYALVAGFVEIGETLEDCVAREVMEETGLRCKGSHGKNGTSCQKYPLLQISTMGQCAGYSHGFLL